MGRHDVLEAGEVGAVRSKGVAVDARADDAGLRLNLELACCLGGVDELELLRVLAVAARLEGMRVALLQVGEAPGAGGTRGSSTGASGSGAGASSGRCRGGLCHCESGYCRCLVVSAVACLQPCLAGLSVVDAVFNLGWRKTAELLASDST